MKQGKEPMRTFGDLLQFFGHKDTPPEKTKKLDGQPTEAKENKKAVPALTPQSEQPEIMAEATATDEVINQEKSPSNEAQTTDKVESETEA
jgi:protein Tex